MSVNFDLGFTIKGGLTHAIGKTTNESKSTEGFVGLPRRNYFSIGMFGVMEN